MSEPNINRKQNDSVCHIAFLHSKMRQRQEDRYLTDIALALQNSGHLVTIYTSEFDEDNALDAVHPNRGPLCLVTSGSWIPNSICGMFRKTMIRLKAMWMAWNLILFPPRPKPKLVVLDTDAVVLFMLYLFSEYKTIYIQHFPHIQCCDFYHCSMQVTSDLLTALTIGYANEIIVQTRCLQDIFARSFPKVEKDSMVLYPCYDTGLWLEDIIDVERIIPDLPKDFKLFVTFGDFKKRSNFKLVLDAVEQLFAFMGSPIKDKIHIVIAGRCSDRSTEQNLYYNGLVNLTKEKAYASQITFLKQLPTVHKKTLIAACTAVIHPTRHELYPGPILAAMSLGRPIIAINCGLGSLLLTHRVTGVLVEPDPYKLALVMHKLVTSTTLQAFLGSMARDCYINHYSFDMFSRKLNEIVLNQVTDSNESTEKSEIPEQT